MNSFDKLPLNILEYFVCLQDEPFHLLFGLSYPRYGRYSLKQEVQERLNWIKESKGFRYSKWDEDFKKWRPNFEIFNHSTLPHIELRTNIDYPPFIRGWGWDLQEKEHDIYFNYCYGKNLIVEVREKSNKFIFEWQELLFLNGRNC